MFTRPRAEMYNTYIYIYKYYINNINLVSYYYSVHTTVVCMIYIQTLLIFSSPVINSSFSSYTSINSYTSYHQLATYTVYVSSLFAL